MMRRNLAKRGSVATSRMWSYIPAAAFGGHTLKAAQLEDSALESLNLGYIDAELEDFKPESDNYGKSMAEREDFGFEFSNLSKFMLNWRNFVENHPVSKIIDAFECAIRSCKLRRNLAE